MKDDKIGACFESQDSLKPLREVKEKFSCDEFEPKTEKSTKYCINCKRFAWIQEGEGEKQYKMYAIKGHPICTNIFDKHNKEYWPDIPEEERIYSESREVWTRKTQKRNDL